MTSDIRQLKQFIAVAEEKHFRLAAERLNMTQPPLSQAIKKLEESLGVQLLSRTNKKVTLTSAGHVYLKGAYETLDKFHQLEEDTKRAAKGLIGRLKIGFSGSAIYEALPLSIRKFKRSHPHIQLEINELATVDQIDAMLKGHQDVGLLRPPISKENLFDVIPMRHEELVMVLPTSHPLAKLKMVNLSDFAADEFITFSPETSPNLHSLIIQCCSDVGFNPKIVQTAPQIQTHISLVAAGMGVSMVPECAAQVTHPNVAFRKIKARKAVNSTTMAIACLKGHDNPVIKAFIEANSKQPVKEEV